MWHASFVSNPFPRIPHGSTLLFKSQSNLTFVPVEDKAIGFEQSQKNKTKVVVVGVENKIIIKQVEKNILQGQKIPMPQLQSYNMPN